MHLGYIWDDGSVPSADMWKTGEPNGIGEKVRYTRTLYGYKGDIHQLADRPWHMSYNFICMKQTGK